jgi:hypothetical protein
MSTDIVTPLRQRMIEDMNARKLCAGTQRAHIRSCRRFAAFLERSPDAATVEVVGTEPPLRRRTSLLDHVIGDAQGETSKPSLSSSP